MSILIFPQLKYLGRIYISQNYLEYSNYPTRTPDFEEIADKELSRQCFERYNTTRVSLIGYSYTQYNENGWSSYPVQSCKKTCKHSSAIITVFIPSVTICRNGLPGL